MCDALKKACEIISDITGSCPFDMYGWEHELGCEQVCGKDRDEIKCWEEYCSQAATKSTQCSHDYANAVRKGRALYVCPKCGQDISFEWVLWAEGILRIESMRGNVSPNTTA